jgi:HisJ family histidinol phosphate phosphatase
MREAAAVKSAYEGRLKVLCGVELGQATFDEGLAASIISDRRVDFVIASLHQLPDKDDFAFLNYDGEDIDSLLREYFGEILKLCEWGKFDALGHLTYTMRYIEGEWGLKPDLSNLDGIIADCLRLLAEKGRGLEINSSGLRQRYGKAFPDLKYIKMFKEAGGEIITVGSDAHKTEDLGKGIKECAELAKEAGFKKIGEKTVRHHSRKYGVTKYGIDRFTKGYLDLLTISFITRFGNNPMHLFGFIGTLMFAVGFFMAGYLGVNKLLFIHRGLRAPLLTTNPYFYIALTVMILGSLFFLTGFLGELINRKSSERNNYLIRDKINIY